MESFTGQGEQSRRIIYIIKQLLNGRRLTTSEMHELFAEMGQSVELRTIQRDFRLLSESLPELEFEKRGNQTYWFIPSKLRSVNSIVRINSEELLSFYVLKAHLKTFDGTTIQNELNELTEKLEELAPGEVYSDESLYWDQNVGQYDYSGHSPVLMDVIHCIINKKWVTITYKSNKFGTEKTYDAFIRKLITYYGIIYAIVYIPKRNKDVALTLQGIEDIKDSEVNYGNAPKFNFNKFTKRRFGIFEKEPIHKVVLKINKRFEVYFLNRHWHQTQHLYRNKDGELILELRVPIVPDFKSWVMSWGEGITVIKPVELIDDLKSLLKKTLSIYQ